MSTAFTKQVYDIVAHIPKGHTMSYKEVATQAGNPRAARAVARIMSQNYNPHIPCHRVIHTNGTLGGYNRGGERVKEKLLKNEGVILP